MNLQKMYLLDLKSLSLVMDKGFYSEKNVDELYRLHHKFLIGVPFSTSLADKAVERNRKTIVSHHRLIEVMGNELYAVTEAKEFEGDETKAYACGSFPIKVKEKGLIGSVSISGLVDPQDHNVVVAALSKLMAKEVPILPNTAWN